jgi:hypothetical protein
MDSGLALRAPRNDEVGSYRRAPAFPRRARARVVHEQSTLRNQRAQGMPGVQRTRSLARKQKKRTSKVTAGSPKLPGIPRANGFNGFLRALPGDRALLSPSFADQTTTLASASGRQNHTTSPSAASALVSCTVRVHRIPLPTSVTIAKRPFDLEQDKANRKCDLGEARSGIFLSARLDRANQLELQREIRFLAHAIFKGSAAETGMSTHPAVRSGDRSPLRSPSDAVATQRRNDAKGQRPARSNLRVCPCGRAPLTAPRSA